MIVLLKVFCVFIDLCLEFSLFQILLPCTFTVLAPISIWWLGVIVLVVFSRVLIECTSLNVQKYPLKGLGRWPLKYLYTKVDISSLIESFTFSISTSLWSLLVENLLVLFSRTYRSLFCRIWTLLTFCRSPRELEIEAHGKDRNIWIPI